MNKFTLKKISFNLLILMFFLLLLEIFSFSFIKYLQNNSIIKKTKNFYSQTQIQNELLEYNNLVPYLNSDKMVELILDKKEKINQDFFYTTIKKFENINKENILIQGDSWAEIANEISIKKLLVSFVENKNFGLINAGISSYSISPMNVQYQILTKKFNLKPSIVIAIIDQTDIGDEIHRYQTLSFNNLSLQATQISNEFQKKFIQILFYEKKPNLLKISLLFKEFYYSRYLQFGSNHFLTAKYITKRLFYLITNTQTVIAPLKYGLSNNEKNILKLRFKNYIENIINSNVKNLVFITHPHKNHLINKNQYNVNISDILEEVIEKTNFQDKIMHINFKNDFNKLYENFDFVSIWRANDPTSHLSIEAYRDVFFPHIFSMCCK